MCQPVDKRVINRIHELVAEGLTNINQVKTQLDFFVKNVLFVDKELPQITNRRFYPTTKDIRTHMFHAKKKNRESSQEVSTPAAEQSPSLDDTVVESSVELPIENVFNETIAGHSDDTHTAFCSDTGADLPDETNVAVSNGTNADLPDDPNDTNEARCDEGEGQRCRDTLEQIRQLTFGMQDEEMLGRLNSKLQELLEEMRLLQVSPCVRQCGDHDHVLVVHENNRTLQTDAILTLNLVNNNEADATLANPFIPQRQTFTDSSK